MRRRPEMPTRASLRANCAITPSRRCSWAPACAGTTARGVFGSGGNTRRRRGGAILIGLELLLAGHDHPDQAQRVQHAHRALELSGPVGPAAVGLRRLLAA